MNEIAKCPCCDGTGLVTTDFIDDFSACRTCNGTGRGESEMIEKRKTPRVSVVEALELIAEYDYPIMKYVNNGIGAYEYWGCKGVDHKWEWEMQDYPGNLKIAIQLPGGTNITDDVITDILCSIEDAIHEKQGEYISHLDSETEGKFNGTIRLEYSFSIQFIPNSTAPFQVMVEAEWLEG